MSPVQTTFGQKVTTITTTQVHPLGTVRIEGKDIYKYTKAGGTIPVRSACCMSASGTVVVGAANLKASGVNNTGTALGSGDYFWMQVAGEIVNCDTQLSPAANGYPATFVLANGTLSGGTAAATYMPIGNASVVATHVSAGIILLSGLY